MARRKKAAADTPAEAPKRRAREKDRQARHPLADREDPLPRRLADCEDPLVAQFYRRLLAGDGPVSWP